MSKLVLEFRFLVHVWRNTISFFPSICFITSLIHKGDFSGHFESKYNKHNVFQTLKLECYCFQQKCKYLKTCVKCPVTSQCAIKQLARASSATIVTLSLRIYTRWRIRFSTRVHCLNFSKFFKLLQRNWWSGIISWNLRAPDIQKVAGTWLKW